MFIAFLYMFMFTGKKCILATFMPINLYLNLLDMSSRAFSTFQNGTN